MNRLRGHLGYDLAANAARASQAETVARPPCPLCSGVEGCDHTVVERALAVGEVRFYRASEQPWGCFSNLMRRPIIFEDRKFPTSEHAYQYGKPRRPEVRDWLMAAPSPGLLAMAAHGLYSWDIAPGWSQAKVERMRQVLAAKFSQHADLREILLSTGEARIVEAPTVDSDTSRFWGEVDGRGRNTLGVLLMELRATLRGGQ